VTGLRNATQVREQLRQMMLIRAFEKQLLSLSPGFQLLSTGEEAVAVGATMHLRPSDQLLTSGRSIAPALARGLDPGRVMAELLGKRDGYCKGQGGRGHLSYPEGGFFGAHAVVAGNLTVAVGVALAQSRRTGAIAEIVFGDGACGAGALHEAMNIAALWRLPLLFLCNNNRYSVSTRVEDALVPAHLAELARPFGIPACTVDGMDVEAVSSACAEATDAVRRGEGPRFVECVSYRFVSHSTSSRESRPHDEIARFRAADPIERLRENALGSGLIDESGLAALRAEVEDTVEAAARFATASPWPDPAESLRDVG
jgi:TPP-dependent pyruvate/acetoin dehydrogenase alpha subunit